MTFNINLSNHNKVGNPSEFDIPAVRVTDSLNLKIKASHILGASVVLADALSKPSVPSRKRMDAPSQSISTGNKGRRLSIAVDLVATMFNRLLPSPPQYQNLRLVCWQYLERGFALMHSHHQLIQLVLLKIIQTKNLQLPWVAP